jgi:hypothetical protein
MFLVVVFPEIRMLEGKIWPAVLFFICLMVGNAGFLFLVEGALLGSWSSSRLAFLCHFWWHADRENPVMIILLYNLENLWKGKKIWGWVRKIPSSLHAVWLISHVGPHRC